MSLKANKVNNLTRCSPNVDYNFWSTIAQNTGKRYTSFKKIGQTKKLHRIQPTISTDETPRCLFTVGYKKTVHLSP
jgi:hypothetical protein